MWNLSGIDITTIVAGAALAMIVLWIPVILYFWYLTSYYHRLWDVCIRRSSIFSVYCKGKRVDTSKFNFSDLNEDDWIFKVNFKRGEIHLKPNRGNKIELPLMGV